MKSRTGSNSKWVLRSWCHALAAFALLRPVHEVGWHLLALADAGNVRRGLSVETFLVSNLPIKGLCTICDSIHPKPELPFSPMLLPEGLLSCPRRQRLLMIPSLKGLPIKSAEINQGDE